MSILAFKGGAITHRYLMGKSKDDIARLYMELLKLYNSSQTAFIEYARHLSACRSHGGHDCDCGRDARVEAIKEND